MSILLDLSDWGVFAEPVPRGRTTRGARYSLVKSMDLSALPVAIHSAIPSATRQLIFVDDPEYVTSTGILYLQPITGEVRVFAYAVNATELSGPAQDLTLVVAIHAPAGGAVTLERLGTGSGVSSGPYAYSMLAAQRWMATNYLLVTGSTQTLSVGQVLEIGTARMPAVGHGQPGYPGYVGNVIVDMQITGPSNNPPVVMVYARQRAPLGNPVIPSNILPSADTPPTRGLFPIADVDVTASPTTSSWFPLPVSGLMPQVGTSYVDGDAAVRNAGFGVVWNVKMPTVNAGPSLIPPPRYAAVGMGPASSYGVQTAAYWTQGNGSTIEGVVAPPGSGLLLPGYAMQLGTVPIGQSASLQWMGTGGIGYPVGVYVLAPQVPTREILNVVGAGMLAGLAGLVAYAAGADA